MDNRSNDGHSNNAIEVCGLDKVSLEIKLTSRELTTNQSINFTKHIDKRTLIAL